MEEGDHKHSMMWLDEDEEEYETQQQASGQGSAAAQPSAEEALRVLEEELERTKKELADVRKDLAAKTVQLSRKDRVAEVVVQEKVVEASNASGELQQALQVANEQVQRLEVQLAQKEEEVEESRRMYAAQKRALKEALSAAAEAEASHQQAEEAQRVVVDQASKVVEDELERLQAALTLATTRCALELRARDTELDALRGQLSAAHAARREAVAAAEAALNEAWQTEVERVQTDAAAGLARLEAEVVQLRGHMEEARREQDSMVLTSELAALNNQKVQIQREFEAFRDMTQQARRQQTEEVAKLLEENASLHSRLAAKAVEAAQAANAVEINRMSKVFTAKTKPSLDNGIATYIPAVLARWEGQRTGFLPGAIIASVLTLIVLVAVVRAAAATRNEHRGGLCFLAKLGIWVGKGCELPPSAELSNAARDPSKDLGVILDPAPRVHDVQLTGEEAKAIAAQPLSRPTTATTPQTQQQQASQQLAQKAHAPAGPAAAAASTVGTSEGPDAVRLGTKQVEGSAKMASLEQGSVSSSMGSSNGVSSSTGSASVSIGGVGTASLAAGGGSSAAAGQLKLAAAVPAAAAATGGWTGGLLASAGSMGGVNGSMTARRLLSQLAQHALVGRPSSGVKDRSMRGGSRQKRVGSGTRRLLARGLPWRTQQRAAH